MNDDEFKWTWKPQPVETPVRDLALFGVAVLLTVSFVAWIVLRW